MDGHDVEQAVAEMVRLLTPHESADWRCRAGTLVWSCWTTAAHVAHDLLAYAGQVAARPDSAYLPLDLVVCEDASPRDLLRIVAGCGRLLSNALAASEPTARAWHWGPTDPSGFAALGANETLVHTYDITEGLGIGWHPPEPLCRAVLARVFPGAPAGDPVQVLLWSTGRVELPGHPRVTSWITKAAID
ncbi:MAG TPA: maleylpyruvate isomerase N-terminal domain-containing protein [Micromonosporaceae bacterium]|nr:maleylpyruvate isomerase N-terminal domain-containing protein [Micromonosporaceae bacterium]